MPPESCKHPEINWEVSDVDVDDENFIFRMTVVCSVCGKVWKKDIMIEP